MEEFTMENNISEMLGQLRDTLFKSTAAMLVSSILSFIIAPRQTKITVDGGVPAQLVVLGKKDDPKAVYVSTKKHSVNILPTLLMLAAAVGMCFVKQRYDDMNK